MNVPPNLPSSQTLFISAQDEAVPADDVEMADAAAATEKNGQSAAAAASPLSFPDYIEDGFQYSPPSAINHEVIVLDARTDPVLSEWALKAQNLIKSLSGEDERDVKEEKRALMLAKFVAIKLGGDEPNIRERLRESVLKHIEETKSKIIPIGRLIGKGLICHRALLFKYLADRSLMDPDAWTRNSEADSKEKAGPIICKLEKAEDHLKCRVEIREYTDLDLLGAAPQFLKPHSPEGKGRKRKLGEKDKAEDENSCKRGKGEESPKKEAVKRKQPDDPEPERQDPSTKPRIELVIKVKEDDKTEELVPMDEG